MGELWFNIHGMGTLRRVLQVLGRCADDVILSSGSHNPWGLKDASASCLDALLNCDQPCVT